MIDVALDRPWLSASFPTPLRVLSWAPHRPGFVTASRVVWREVRDEDLTEDFDAVSWLGAELSARGESGSVAFLTSRNIARFHLETASSDRISATCLATVGLSNVERVGHRRRVPAHVGTVNLLVAMTAPLTDPAMIEALSIATEARTAAILDLAVALPSGLATGTGTDCIALACPPGDVDYAGLHTAVGEAIGRAVYDAVLAGGREWIDSGGAG